MKLLYIHQVIIVEIIISDEDLIVVEEQQVVGEYIYIYLNIFLHFKLIYFLSTNFILIKFL